MPAADTTGERAPAPGLSDQQSVKLKYAIKTALALTLAYLTPMALGWPQPQTAAITVMLIAATGTVSESLQKGVLRILGTLAGAAIGLSLIALFPQDRALYLLAASVAVAVCIYFYNAYQGDGTMFMLCAVVTLMVFNGGNADGAFIYGVERTLLTVHGVIVYTLTASLLWPVKRNDTTIDSATALTDDYRQALAKLAAPQGENENDEQVEEFIAMILQHHEQFLAQQSALDGNASLKAGFDQEWSVICEGYRSLRETLLTALQTQGYEEVQLDQFLANHDALLGQLDALFIQLESAWQGREAGPMPTTLPTSFRSELLIDQDHMTIAAVAARSELLQQTQQTLVELLAAVGNLLHDQSNALPDKKSARPARIIWWDLDNFKTAVRTFITFWLATAIWIAYNPPGGFMFVTLCTALVPLVSYTPVSPKVLIILFSLGFLFALPAYIFLLPQMTHWLELSLFLFSYAFIGFFVFQGPVSIFFLLGLFTLGIQNEMSYNFNVILLVIAMFYMVCTLLIISIHFPFTSKAERIYDSIRGRFFNNCAELLRQRKSAGGRSATAMRKRADQGSRLLANLGDWGGRVDSKQFPTASPENVQMLHQRCELLQAQLQELIAQDQRQNDDKLIDAMRGEIRGSPLAELCELLSRHKCPASSSPSFTRLETELAALRERLEQTPPQTLLANYSHAELARFYIALNLQATILRQLAACREAQQALDWQQLAGSRF